MHSGTTLHLQIPCSARYGYCVCILKIVRIAFFKLNCLKYKKEGKKGRKREGGREKGKQKDRERVQRENMLLV